VVQVFEDAGISGARGRKDRPALDALLKAVARREADMVADQALGRSRGGFSTKIHLKTDFGGLPIAFHLTGGEASDSRNFETLLDISPDLNPRAALGDKGYDSKSNRDAARQLGICLAIP
jgi:hypothetical protein